jgi:putative glutamine amidotransferase
LGAMVKEHAGLQISEDSSSKGKNIILPVNSSHHQAADLVGDGLRVAARCAQDGIIEALEGTSRDHFVLAVQWHPERSANENASQAIFRGFIQAVR